MGGVTADTPVQIAVLGPVAVSYRGRTLAGHALGGRRARVALVALALSDGPLSAERLAAIIWADEAPTTWPAALRGVIRGLRAVLLAVGAGGQALITTTPAGYGLAASARVDVADLAASLRHAAELAGQGRHQATLDAATPLAVVSGDQLLPGEDAAWLEPHRRELDDIALRAQEMIAAAAGALGDHHRATAAARRAVAAQPLDERSHRALIRALHRAADRAGVVVAYEECRSLLADQLGVDPDPETMQAYLAVLGEQGTPAAARLPVVGSTFFGREAESAQLKTAISQPGLVTVVGRGGVGKSRLVIQVAAHGAALPGGRLWVPLTAVTADELVASSVAMSVGISPGADDVMSQLTGHLAPLGRALLILDGCEAVIDGVASLVAGLLAFCPMLSVAVTSRVPLSVEGERVVVLGPLPGPAGSGRPALLASLQVRLLTDRVRRGGARLDVDDAAAPFVVELCRRCGGLPLALELVAAQLAAMSLADLLDHLPDVFADGEDRLRAIARSSYELLDSDEALVFRLFGVLDGPVALPFVREVTAGGPIAPLRVVRILRELTARGLLMVDRTGPRWRYQQDDDLHVFARELLADAGEERPALGRLADAVQAILPADPRTAPAPHLAAVGDVLPCLRLLLSAAIDGRLPRDRGLELCFRLHRYWATTDVTEGRFWLSRLLAGEPRTPYAAYATFALGYLCYWSGDAEAAVSELQAAVEMLTQPDEYVARALVYLGGLADDLDRGAEALGFVERSISAAAPFGADLQVSAAIGTGCVLAERADPRAAGYARDAVDLCRRAASAEQLAAMLPTAAMVSWQVGDLAAARRYIDEAQPLLAGSRRIARVVLLSAAAGVALATGDTGAAIEFGTTAARDAGDLGIDREVPLARTIVARAHLERGELAAAARQALAAVTAARSLSFTFPLAVCLEAAALVCLAGGVAGSPGPADPSVAGRLLAAAAAIRERGDRPGPPTLRGAVDEARAATAASVVATGPPLGPAAAAELATAALSSPALSPAARLELGDNACRRP
jgi:predicted ATPase/DNA-binding SARP family transcriptional activator